MPAIPTSAAPALSLQRCIQTFDDALPAALCARMIESFHALARFQRPNGEGHRAGLEASGWTELDLTPLSDASFRGMLAAQMEQYLARYNAALGLTLPVPPSPRTSEWIIKRYQPDANHRFQPHFDSLGPVANRYLVFLWYLNDVAAGGETYFTDLDVAVTPKAGRLLMFPPYWMFQHEGRRPLSGDKYILSTYYLF